MLKRSLQSSGIEYGWQNPNETSCCRVSDSRRVEQKFKSSSRKVLQDFVPEVDARLEFNSCILVWCLPSHLSQSKLGGRPNSSNACTIIALKMAQLIHEECLFFPSSKFATISRNPWRNTLFPEAVYNIFDTNQPSVLTSIHERNSAGLSSTTPPFFGRQHQQQWPAHFYPSASTRFAIPQDGVQGRSGKKSILALVNALANSIVDGNTIHASAVVGRRPSEHNFTIPDAIYHCDGVFQELDYNTVRGPLWRFGFEYIRRAVGYWSSSSSRDAPLLHSNHLFLLLIAFERSVLLVYQPQDELIALVDSHSHGCLAFSSSSSSVVVGGGSWECGAVMAVCRLSELETFVNWLSTHIFPESLTDVNHEFEISALRYCPTAMRQRHAAVVAANGGKEECQIIGTKGMIFGAHPPCPLQENQNRTSSASVVVNFTRGIKRAKFACNLNLSEKKLGRY